MATNASACASGQTCCRSSSNADCTKNIDQIENLNKLTIDGEDEKPKSFALAKRHGRGAVQSGLTHECGVFGAMACNEWPTQVSESESDNIHIYCSLVYLGIRTANYVILDFAVGYCANHLPGPGGTAASWPRVGRHCHIGGKMRQEL